VAGHGGEDGRGKRDVKGMVRGDVRGGPFFCIEKRRKCVKANGIERGNLSII